MQTYNVKHIKSLSRFAFLLITIFTIISCEHENKESDQLSTTAPIPNTSQWWQDRHQKIVDADKSKVELLFIGDSITHRWEENGLSIWQQYYNPEKTFNMGFNADKTQHVLWRIENGELDNVTPKLTFLLIGTNNSEYSSAEDIAKGIIKNIEVLSEKLPKTKLVVLKIFPRGDANSKYRKVTHEASEIVAKTVDNKSTFYLDINDHFLDAKDDLIPELMTDGLHLSEKGYETWANAISHVVSQY